MLKGEQGVKKPNPSGNDYRLEPDTEVNKWLQQSMLGFEEGNYAAKKTSLQSLQSNAGIAGHIVHTSLIKLPFKYWTIVYKLSVFLFCKVFNKTTFRYENLPW